MIYNDHTMERKIRLKHLWLDRLQPDQSFWQLQSLMYINFLNLLKVIYNFDFLTMILTLTASGFSVGTGSDFKYGTKLPATKSLANFSKFSTLQKEKLDLYF